MNVWKQFTNACLGDDSNYSCFPTRTEEMSSVATEDMSSVAIEDVTWSSPLALVYGHPGVPFVFVVRGRFKK